jgi:hypothetical protein
MPRKKHPKLEILDGRPGKRPVPDIGDFLPSLGEAFIPAHLSEEAQACAEVIKASMPDGIYSQGDSYTIAAFAMACAVHQKAAHFLSNPKAELVIENAGEDHEHNLQPALNLWLKVLNDQAKIIALLGDRLGLNPRARMAVQMPTRKPPRSKFENLLGPNVSSRSLNA